MVPVLWRVCLRRAPALPPQLRRPSCARLPCACPASRAARGANRRRRIRRSCWAAFSGRCAVVAAVVTADAQRMRSMAPKRLLLAPRSGACRGPTRSLCGVIRGCSLGGGVLRHQSLRRTQQSRGSRQRPIARDRTVSPLQPASHAYAHCAHVHTHAFRHSAAAPKPTAAAQSSFCADRAEHHDTGRQAGRQRPCTMPPSREKPSPAPRCRTAAEQRMHPASAPGRCARGRAQRAARHGSKGRGTAPTAPALRRRGPRTRPRPRPTRRAAAAAKRHARAGACLHGAMHEEGEGGGALQVGGSAFLARCTSECAVRAAASRAGPE